MNVISKDIMQRYPKYNHVSELVIDYIDRVEDFDNGYYYVMYKPLEAYLEQKIYGDDGIWRINKESGKLENIGYTFDYMLDAMPKDYHDNPDKYLVSPEVLLKFKE